MWTSTVRSSRNSSPHTLRRSALRENTLPGLEANYPVYLVVAGCQHDDWHVALGADPPYDLSAVELGEHDVEHYKVRLEGLERFQSGLAVTGDLYLESLALEGMREHLLERRLVVDQKDLARHTL